MLQKFVIILADNDELYVDKLTEFINESYAPQIKVYSFTRIEDLVRFWPTDGLRADALLIKPDFLAELPIYDHEVKHVVLLSDGRLHENCTEYPSIYKFQSADKIITELMDTFLEQNPMAAAPRYGLSRSRVITGYSPAGGVGKTSVLIGLAAELAQMGSSVLYLDLESVSSADLFPSCRSNYGLTHVLLTLKERPSLMPMKVERYCITSEHNFHFLGPAENFLELSGLTGSELSVLLQTLQAADKYDFILVDPDSAASEKALAILEASDLVLLVITPDITARHKVKSFLCQAIKAALGRGDNPAAKMIAVLNKDSGDGYLTEQAWCAESGLPDFCQIPFISGLWSETNGQPVFDVYRSFRNSLGPLLEKIQKANPA